VEVRGGDRDEDFMPGELPGQLSFDGAVQAGLDAYDDNEDE
jgi:hypothetical protein